VLPHEPDVGYIRNGLACDRSCECNRPRGRVHCPLHDAAKSGKPDLSVTKKGGTVLLHCYVCGKAEQTALLSALQDRGLWPKREPAEVIPFNASRSERKVRGPEPKVISTTPYEIRDLDGIVQAIHVRNDLDNGTKEYIWQQADGRLGLAGRKVLTMPLFGMELLKSLSNGATVVLHEGEKATKAGRQLGLTSLGTVTGADTIPIDDVLRELVRFDVVRWDDHDDKGHTHMRRISERLAALGGSSRVLTWPEAPLKGDAADFLNIGGTASQAASMVATAVPFNPIADLPIINAVDLAKKQFSEPKVVVPGLLIEGATMLVAPGKSGKSRLMMATAAAVAHGGAVLGSILVDGGDVLYLALEDGERRGRRRMLEASGGDPPKRLDLAFKWPDMDNGGVEMIEKWLREKPDARLVIIDTLKRFRPKTNGRRNAYDEDYEALSPLNDLALKYGVCIVIVHHTNKIKLTDDPTDRASGSTGMLAACDGMIVMERTRGQADSVLHVYHRDTEDAQVAIKADPVLGWKWLGDAVEYSRTELQDQIVGVILDTGRPLQPGDIATALDRDRKLTGTAMWKMTKPNSNGLQILVSQGGYYWPASRPWPGSDPDDDDGEDIGNRGNRGNRGSLGNRGNQDDQEGLFSEDGSVSQAAETQETGLQPSYQDEPVAPVSPVSTIPPVWRCTHCQALERNGDRCGGCGRPSS
jgi:hypothetical protein